MEMVSAMSWAASRGYESYTQNKLQRALDKAQSEEVSLHDLTSTEPRFAMFVTMVRALERCANNDMADFLAEVMVGGLRQGVIEKKADIFQMVMTALGSMTITEVRVLALMRELGLWPELHRQKVNFEVVAEFEKRGMDEVGLSKELMASILDGMTRTGLVNGRPQAWGGGVPNSNTLTPLAEELFSVMDYRNRLTS